MCRGLTLTIERQHARNQKRTGKRSGRTRGWRRQVATCIAFLAKERFQKTSEQHATRCNMLSTMTWQSFARRTARRGKRAGIGGNNKFSFINTMSKAHKGKRIDGETFKGLRRDWAQRIDRARDTPEPCHQNLQSRGLLALASEAFQRSRRRTRDEHKAATAQPVSKNLRASDPKTHLGMGSAVFPIAEDVLESRCTRTGAAVGCYKRSGLRRLAQHMLKETDFIVPAAQEPRLQVHRRPCCETRHPGFCILRDVHYEVRYKVLLANLQKSEKPEFAGVRMLRFTHEQPAGLPFVEPCFNQFAWERGNPTYLAVYMPVNKTDDALDFPFFVEDCTLDRAAVEGPGAFDLVSASFQHVWEVALELAKTALDAIRVKMESIEYEVMDRLSLLRATSAVSLCDNALAPPERKPEKTKATDKGGLRSTAALALLANRRDPRPRRKPREDEQAPPEEAPWWAHAAFERARERKDEARREAAARRAMRRAAARARGDAEAPGEADAKEEPVLSVSGSGAEDSARSNCGGLVGVVADWQNEVEDEDEDDQAKLPAKKRRERTVALPSGTTVVVAPADSGVPHLTTPEALADLQPHDVFVDPSDFVYSVQGNVPLGRMWKCGKMWCAVCHRHARGCRNSVPESEVSPGNVRPALVAWLLRGAATKADHEAIPVLGAASSSSSSVLVPTA